MKRFIRVATLPALLLASSGLTFAIGQAAAGGQTDKARAHSGDGIDDRTGVTRAVQQGKGGGRTRNTSVPANAYRTQTAQDAAALKDESGVPRTNRHDLAFRK
jgi:hypothetical protein